MTIFHNQKSKEVKMTTEKFRPKPKFTTQVTHVDYDTGEIISKQQAQSNLYYKLKSTNHGIKWNNNKTEGTIIRTTLHRRKQFVQQQFFLGK